jgi:PIN domain nuclease of toxin-antitoxin system
VKLLLDTTYLLQAIGISVKELPKDTLIKLLSKRHQITISDISVFELSAKAAKHITAGTLPAERVTKGVRAITYDERIEIIPFNDSKLLLTSFKLRSMLNDFIDCLILSTALNHCDTLITEDNDIQNLKKNREFNAFLETANPKFQIQKLTEIL